jgi:hypothetical protein
MVEVPERTHSGSYCGQGVEKRAGPADSAPELVRDVGDKGESMMRSLSTEYFMTEASASLRAESFALYRSLTSSIMAAIAVLNLKRFSMSSVTFFMVWWVFCMREVMDPGTSSHDGAPGMSLMSITSRHSLVRNL